MTGIFRGFPLLLVRWVWFRLEESTGSVHGLLMVCGSVTVCLVLLIEDVSGLDWLQLSLTHFLGQSLSVKSEWKNSYYAMLYSKHNRKRQRGATPPDCPKP